MRRRFREADRALQVAVVRDLQQRETAVLLMVGQSPQS